MLYLDVYNILHVTGVLPAELAGIDLHGLLRLIATSRYNQQEIVAVCDGVRPQQMHTAMDGTSPAARVLFSGDASDADGLIEKLLASTPRSKKPLVISSDHRLRRAAGKSHAKHLRSEVFLHHLAIDLARHDRGESKDSRRKSQARPAFATDIPLDRLSTLQWLNDLEASDAEKHALTEADRIAAELALRLFNQPPSHAAQQHHINQAAKPAPQPPARSPGKSARKTKPHATSKPPSLGSITRPTSSDLASQPSTAKPLTASSLTQADRTWLIAAGLTESDLDMNFWLNKGPAADKHVRR